MNLFSLSCKLIKDERDQIYWEELKKKDVPSGKVGDSTTMIIIIIITIIVEPYYYFRRCSKEEK